MLIAKWDRPSETWIRDQKRFAERLYPHLRLAMAGTLNWAVGQVRPNIPFFEGDLRRDFRALGIERLTTRRLGVRGSIGFTGATVQPAMESAGGPSPFAIGLGKHAPGASVHEVYLYHPGTGGSTKGRAKLVRWLKSRDARYGGLPDAPTKADVREWQRRERIATGKQPAPFVTVDPSASATSFLWDLIAADGDPLMGELANRVWQAIRRVW